MTVPLAERRTKFPELSSTATAPAPPPVLLLLTAVDDAQKVWPLESDRASCWLLVMASLADPPAGARLAIHTRLCSGMLLYQITMYKKPRAKLPSLEMSLSPGDSGFACVSWSPWPLDWQDRLKSRRIKTGRRATISSPLVLNFSCAGWR
ncbi:hypothetical protein U9M48_033966 [Paspalum notatum var. saurae]|uniref:Uncharacterized protein n=1 Tax=Paspalum notatum var. saurae TaxID=547442 RepID=A0AAQ3UB96_PASNO